MLVFGVGTYFQVRGALPPYAGHYEVKGLKAPVEILRDKNAVPHIIAGSIEDAAFGLGFVHAQDRFWQMELMRRLGQGRLSEILPPAIVGNGIVDTDRTMRGLGVYRAASDSVGALSPRHPLRCSTSYAAGREFLARPAISSSASSSRWSSCCRAVATGPSRGRPADSLVWAKLMALGLDGNWRQELLRAAPRQEGRRRTASSSC